MIPTPTISDKGDWNGGIFLDVHPLNLSGVDDVGCLRGRHRGRHGEDKVVGAWERDTAREGGRERESLSGRKRGGREGRRMGEGGREGGREGEGEFKWKEEGKRGEGREGRRMGEGGREGELVRWERCLH